VDLPLAPGTVIVVLGDPELLRFVFPAPTVEFVIARARIEDGVTLYAPTETRGVMPLEILSRSATTVWPTAAPVRASAECGARLSSAKSRARTPRSKDFG
jgi:hypothetical protein